VTYRVVLWGGGGTVRLEILDKDVGNMRNECKMKPGPTAPRGDPGDVGLAGAVRPVPVGRGEPVQ
jgi:hypothetical protein